MADAICKVVADCAPIAYGAFEDCRMGGVTLSSKALDCLPRMLKGEAELRRRKRVPGVFGSVMPVSLISASAVSETP